MFRRTLTALALAAALVLSLLTVSCRAADPCETMLAGMTTQEKISQMIMPAFRTWPDAAGRARGVTAINSDIAACLQHHGFAGVILFAENLTEASQALRLTAALQQANAAGGNRSQLLLAVDQEGGNITRLGKGTLGPGNMALGAADSPADTTALAAVLGEEIMAEGLNMNFAPVLDVNDQPANPVIGLRSFSDDAGTAADQGVAYLRGMEKTGVIATLKHFPGHGNTATDSHTSLPRVDRSYDRLKANELAPFQASIDAGAEAVMTAHIQFPQLEKTTYPSISTGQPVTLPATLSKTIITGVLRGDMGFDGVVVTDALEMDAIAKHFSRLDTARLAIGAGVDILLVPVSTNSRAGIAALDRYIADVAAMADKGTISMDQVDAAVLRILRLKEAHGLLTPYDGSGLEARAKTAASTVGSAAHHETEWEVTKKAITLVKNQNGVLPLTRAGQKVLVLTAYDNEITAMNYALGRLREEGRLAAGSAVTVRSCQNRTYAQLAPLLRGMDHVIVVSETSGAAGLRGTAAARTEQIIAGTHAAGGRVTVLSAGLPYDAARFPAADAILLAWGSKGMSEDPRTALGTVASYGPNLPAALYLAFTGDQTPQGKLPVNLPALNGNYQYTASVLYPRGYGLTYPGVLIRHDPLCGDTETCPILPFVDADPGAWYHDGVHNALETGLMRGMGGNRFAPDAATSRAMLVTMLWRQAGGPGVAAPLPFADVAGDAWYAQPVAWAAEEGVVSGVSPAEFAPDAPVTREQLAAILYRLAGSPMPGGTLTAPDAASVSDYAYEAMCWATEQEILRGLADGTLAPGAQATRAQVATMLMRYAALP